MADVATGQMFRTGRPVLAPMLAGCLLLAAGQADAAAAISVVGTGSMADGREPCIEQGMEDAKRKAVAQEIARLDGGYDAARHGRLVDRAGEFVARKMKRPKFRDLGNGFCEVATKARVDARALSEALKSVSAGGARVGAVVRYIIGGKLAEDTGGNSLQAVNTLSAELGKRNCRLVDLLFEQDLFARKLRAVEIPLTGDEDGPDEVYETGLSHAEAVRNVMIGARQELERQLGLGREGFDRVITGEVAVTDMGKDPDSPNVRARALVSLSLQQVTKAEILGTTRPIPIMVPGTDKAAARNLALEAAMETAVSELAQRVDICAG